jgi:hypothetical protein
MWCIWRYFPAVHFETEKAHTSFKAFRTSPPPPGNKILNCDTLSCSVRLLHITNIPRVFSWLKNWKECNETNLLWALMFDVRKQLLLSRSRLCHYSVGGAWWHLCFYESFYYPVRVISPAKSYDMGPSRFTSHPRGRCATDLYRP